MAQQSKQKLNNSAKNHIDKVLMKIFFTPKGRST